MRPALETTRSERIPFPTRQSVSGGQLAGGLWRIERRQVTETPQEGPPRRGARGRPGTQPPLAILPRARNGQVAHNPRIIEPTGGFEPPTADYEPGFRIVRVVARRLALEPSRLTLPSPLPGEGSMRVFISSVITGHEHFRDAGRCRESSARSCGPG
jgi:hypothetical protein